MSHGIVIKEKTENKGKKGQSKKENKKKRHQITLRIFNLDFLREIRTEGIGKSPVSKIGSQCKGKKVVPGKIYGD